MRGHSALELTIHLALFVAGGSLVVLAAVAALERLVPDTRRVIRAAHLAVAAAACFLLFVAERLYHSG